MDEKQKSLSSSSPAAAAAEGHPRDDTTNESENRVAFFWEHQFRRESVSRNKKHAAAIASRGSVAAEGSYCPHPSSSEFLFTSNSTFMSDDQLANNTSSRSGTMKQQLARTASLKSVESSEEPSSSPTDKVEISSSSSSLPSPSKVQVNPVPEPEKQKQHSPTDDSLIDSKKQVSDSDDFPPSTLPPAPETTTMATTKTMKTNATTSKVGKSPSIGSLGGDSHRSKRPLSYTNKSGKNSNNNSTKKVDEKGSHRSFDDSTDKSASVIMTTSTMPMAPSPRASLQRPMPGAYAHTGPGADTSIPLDDSYDLYGYHDNNNHLGFTGAPASNNDNNTNGLVHAEQIDDAETITYAKDVDKDNFERRFRIFVVIAFVICAVIFGLVFGLRHRSDDICIFGDDDICCNSTQDELFSNIPSTIPDYCHCYNTTQGVYGNYSQKNIILYDQLREAGIARNWSDPDTFLSLDPNSCDPWNQVFLAFANPQAWRFEGNLQDIPELVRSTLIGILYFYHTMGGLEWDQRTDWHENIWFCSWFGVGCVFVNTLSKLSLPANNLRGRLVTEIGLMRTLLELNLSNNEHVTGPIPTELTQLRWLRVLNLSGISVNGPIPTELSQLSVLDQFSLNDAKVTGTIPTEVCHMENLRLLELSKNSLQSTIPTEIGLLSSTLQALRLDDNQLVGSLPTELQQLSKLQLLSVDRNNLSGPIPEFIASMTNLVLIDIYDSGLIGPIPEAFCAPLSSSTSSSSSLPQEREDDNGRRGIGRQIVMNCLPNIEFCSCCSESTTTLIQVICGEGVPEEAIGFN